jgi:phosphoglycerate dehydrogenase-like enzyme
VSAPAPPTVVTVTFGPADAALEDVLGPDVELRSVAGAADEERARILAESDVLLCWNFGREIGPGEGRHLPARFVQLVSAGADHLPFERLPAGALVASNVGAYSEPMAEHVLAMALALRKRLPANHAKLASGVWDQSPTRWLSGSVCGIVGLGGIGKAAARRFAALGARIQAVNTTGRTEEPVEFVGTLDDLDRVLRSSDVVVLSLPLTRRTTGIIGARELALMKADAVLVNVGRGPLVDEGALYEHLLRHGEFSAGIDTWWGEPFHHGAFHVDHPFFELPNVLGSPHNSALVPGVVEQAMVLAAANIRRFLDGGPVTGVVRPEDYVTG